jgi:regulator of RNase E activity RraA
VSKQFARHVFHRERSFTVSHEYRVYNCHERADPALVKALADVPTAIISDNLQRLESAGPRIRPLHKQGVLAGTAVTVKTRPGDNLMIHKAVDIALPGDVIVVDGAGDLTNALIGELILRHAVGRGIAGFVVNGAARDMDYIQAADFPVYAAGITHRGPYKDGPGVVNGPISIDGMTINPGDIIIGDIDGVVSVPRLAAEIVLKNSLAQVGRENTILAAIATADWDRAWVDDLLRSRGCVGV